MKHDDGKYDDRKLTENNYGSNDKTHDSDVEHGNNGKNQGEKKHYNKHNENDKKAENKYSEKKKNKYDDENNEKN